MGATIRARVKGGALELLEPLDIPEGEEVLATIERIPGECDLEAFRRSAGGWKGLVDGDKLIKDIYESRSLITCPELKL